MARVLDIKTFKDDRGTLSVIERVLPFEIKRVYYIYHCNDEVRGGHRHKKTKQALVCPAGSCEIYWTDSSREETVLLDRPDKILLLDPQDWHTMAKFTNDAVLLVLASEYFDAEDYIDEGY